MFGKQEWFKRRKYGGWGLYPATWQGWVYVGIFMVPLMVFHALPYWTDHVRIAVTTVWLGVLFLDTLHIMTTLKRDEREYKIEAMAERNASWVMVFVVMIGVLYQVFTSAVREKPEIDPFLIAVLIGGLLAKSISNIIYELKKL